MDGYGAGKTMKELAAEFGINRNTVKAHLLRAETPLRRVGLSVKQEVEAIDLYKADWSSGRLAERYGVSADTILRALRGAVVALRPRRGGPRPKA